VRRIKPAAYDDRLTLVEHLDELRWRIVVSAVVLAVAVGLCFWQNELVLEIANEPLPAGFEPITFSPTEPFFTTVKLSIYGGLLLALPVLLYQAYAFVLPAFSPHERRAVAPFLLMVPFLFIGGAAFAYFAVMPAALDFLLGFNADEFNIEVTRLGIVTPEQLARNRRYAVLVIAVAAMLLPGTDPVTMLLAMLPLYGLFEFSLGLARRFGKPPGDAAAKPEVSTGEAGS
jgi:sec-independent protein translocase protein TatC